MLLGVKFIDRSELIWNLIIKILMGAIVGLLIDGNTVKIDHSIKNHLITTEKGNPKILKVENNYGYIEVFSIFTRLKDASKDRRHRDIRKIGDNCPLIYALKGKDNLITNHSTIRELLDVGGKIVKKNFSITGEEVIVCAPSSHSLVLHIAHKVGDLLKLPVHTNILKKVSVASAIVDLQNATRGCTTYAERKEILNQIEILKKQTSFSLKEISTKHRHLINPVGLSNKIKSDTIIIIDDLVSSGTTLIAAKNLLKSSQCCSSVRALSLFSNM